MKKNFMKGMTMLFASMAFVACSHDVSFNEDYASENVKAQYKSNFEKKYGKIDPTQSWDFTGYTSASQARTRGKQSVTSESVYLFNTFKTLVKNDRNTVETSIDYTTTDDLKLWNPNLSITLYPAYSHAIQGEKYSYYHLGIVENGELYDLTANINTKEGYWYDAQKGSLNHNSGRKINSKSFQEGENSYWVAYYTYPNTTAAYKESNKAIMASMAEFKIEYYKEIVVNGDKYWCFDCNGDRDFSDLICLVDNADPAPIRKRYMIEDLGATDDFDFNDIVVDVIQESNGNQKAIVRAMGGTLNFTLTIGNTTWTKDGSKVNVRVNGEIVEQDTEVATMYNTQAPEYDFVLAEFTVTGWDWRNNNISVTVDGNDNVSEKKVIPFPREGEAPMIIAFDPVTTHWNLERVPFETDFFKPLTDDVAEE